MTRRTFLWLGGAAISASASASAGFYTWRIEPHRLEITRRRLPIRRLPNALSGRTLAHVSDVHVGQRVDDGYVVTTFERIKALAPDIVVITGDLLSYHPAIFDQLPNVYRHFPSGRLATLAIPGNHDYGVNWSQPEVVQRLSEVVAPFGIRMLRNEVCDVEGLQVAGLDDMWARRLELGATLRQLDADRPSLVLSHNPDTVDLPGWDGYDGWILAGHTHGGQCKPPFLPPPLLPVLNRRYTCGEFELSGDRRLYISRGIGHLLQVRFNVRPEVTLFELRPA